MIHIFLIRHGQTDWNLQRRLQGHTDVPLNEFGRTQSRALKEILSKHEIEAFFSSDLIRAIETAELARHREEIPVIIEAGLREAALGEAEGLYFEDLHLKFPDAYKRWLSTDERDDFAFPGGETKSEHRVRLQKALESVFETLESKNLKKIGIVTHGGAMRRILELSKGFNTANFRAFNTSVFELRYDRMQKELQFIAKIYSPEC
jgi:probable phosphoglycerate mutase